MGATILTGQNNVVDNGQLLLVVHLWEYEFQRIPDSDDVYFLASERFQTKALSDLDHSIRSVVFLGFRVGLQPVNAHFSQAQGGQVKELRQIVSPFCPMVEEELLQAALFATSPENEWWPSQKLAELNEKFRVASIKCVLNDFLYWQGIQWKVLSPQIKAVSQEKSFFIKHQAQEIILRLGEMPESFSPRAYRKASIKH
jgi:hypothetical protein